MVDGTNEALPILKKLKRNRRQLTIPISFQKEIIAHLILLTPKNCNKYIPYLARWRKKHLEWFPSQFKVTQKGTRKWFIEKVHKTPDRLLFILVSKEKKPYGHMGLFRFDYLANTCEIDNVVRGEDILPGTMKGTLEQFIEWTIQTFHIKTIYLRTFLDNTRAIRLYRKCGFKNFEKIPLKKHVAGKTIQWTEVPHTLKSPDNRYHLRMILKK